MRLALFGDDADVDACLRLAPRLPDARLFAIDASAGLKSDVIEGVVVCSLAAWQDCPFQDARLLVGFLDRFMPSVQAIRRSLEAGELGDPGLIRIHRWGSRAEVTSDIDLAIWMFAAMPTEVYAIARPGREDVPEYMQVHLGFPAGGMGVIDVSRRTASSDGYFSLSLIGSSGAAYADDHRNQQLLFQGERTSALKTGERDAARLAQLQEFVDAINEQREPAVTAADVDAALLVRDAALKSAESGRAAHLSGEQYVC